MILRSDFLAGLGAVPVAATTPIFLAPIGPLVVSTPVTAPLASRVIAFTSQFWMMSTPRALAPRA